MTPDQKILVLTSFSRVAPIAGMAAKLFYDRLFELDPSLKQLFHGDMEEQGRKLMMMLQVAVANLDRLEGIMPAMRALGERHARYGVEERHYHTVAAALLWTLELALGDEFTPETRAAWVEVYTVLTNVMKEAAAEYEELALSA